MEIPPDSPAIRSQGRQTLGDEGETRLGEDYSEVSTHAQGWRSMRLEYYQLAGNTPVAWNAIPVRG